jgi:transporter family-2 protein
MQPGINAVAARSFGSPIAATVLSVGITLVVSAVIMVLLRETPAQSMFATLPWWIGFGGVIGVLVVAGGATIVPITGAAAFFVCLIAGQLVGSVVLDHLGAFGLEIRSISPLRLLGILCAFAGVVLVRLG